MADVTKIVKIDKKVLVTSLAAGVLLILATPTIQRGGQAAGRWLRRKLRF